MKKQELQILKAGGHLGDDELLENEAVEPMLPSECEEGKELSANEAAFKSYQASMEELNVPVTISYEEFVKTYCKGTDLEIINKI